MSCRRCRCALLFSLHGFWLWMAGLARIAQREGEYSDNRPHPNPGSARHKEYLSGRCQQAPGAVRWSRSWCAFRLGSRGGFKKARALLELGCLPYLQHTANPTRPARGTLHSTGCHRHLRFSAALLLLSSQQPWSVGFCEEISHGTWPLAGIKRLHFDSLPSLASPTRPCASTPSSIPRPVHR